ncbi:gliding motility lipoprotein GldH [Sphingobacterium corticibacter]|uniref:Gliding motility lipoprotein GldH n=1 Tax=Sphingobacterium corticibacter TaxID=2171749 RepID=A0A2T8HKG5_9SPHI|nr:gliding motility lipoprotein GldH [Sphingobacterium corticibacter]PVH25802.1 hypothetical protein DC487_07665 [Sphingobacterium corticibacter]
MLKAHSLILLSLVWLLLFASCDPHIAYEKNNRIDDYRWNRDSVAQFSAHIVDVSQPYQIAVNVRHNNFYPYTNLVFSVEQQHASGKDTTYNIELSLAKEDGRWLGQSAGNLYHIKEPIIKTYLFPDTGVYHFSVQHHMEDHELMGITDIGLLIAQKP